FYCDHVETRRALAQHLCFLVLGRLVEPLRRLEIRELEEREALGPPISLQDRQLTAAGDEAAPAGCHGCWRGLLVELVLLRIMDVNVDDDVRSHRDSFLTRVGEDFHVGVWSANPRPSAESAGSPAAILHPAARSGKRPPATRRPG